MKCQEHQKNHTWISQETDEIPLRPFKWRLKIDDAADSPGEASISLVYSCKHIKFERRLASRTKWNLSLEQEFSDRVRYLEFQCSDYEKGAGIV